MEPVLANILISQTQETMGDPSLKILETERRYVARELHDGIAQTTQQLGLQAAICLKLLERDNLERLANELAELERRIQVASTQVRDLISDMRPPQVEPHADLEEYLQEAIDGHQERGGPPVEFTVDLAESLPDLSPLHLLALVRIVQEALLNIRKHARASRVRLALSSDCEHIYVTINDNGIGFDPAEKSGAGLANLHARAQLIDGKVHIGRDSGGEWTEVKLVLPR